MFRRFELHRQCGPSHNQHLQLTVTSGLRRAGSGS